MVRDQNTDESLRRKRLMLLLHLFLVHRYKIDAIHYVTPTDDNHRQTESMQRLGIFESVTDEVGEIIVAEIAASGVAPLLADDGAALGALIAKK